MSKYGKGTKSLPQSLFESKDAKKVLKEGLKNYFWVEDNQTLFGYEVKEFLAKQYK